MQLQHIETHILELGRVGRDMEECARERGGGGWGGGRNGWICGCSHPRSQSQMGMVQQREQTRTLVELTTMETLRRRRLDFSEFSVTCARRARWFFEKLRESLMRRKASQQGQQGYSRVKASPCRPSVQICALRPGGVDRGSSPLDREILVGSPYTVPARDICLRSALALTGLHPCFRCTGVGCCGAKALRKVCLIKLLRAGSCAEMHGWCVRPHSHHPPTHSCFAGGNAQNYFGQPR